MLINEVMETRTEVNERFTQLEKLDKFAGLYRGFCLAAIVLETPGMRCIICVSPESTTYGLAR